MKKRNPRSSTSKRRRSQSGPGRRPPKATGEKSTAKPVRRERRGGSIADLVARQPWDALKVQLAAASMDTTAVVPRLAAYAELLLDWNRNVSNLVSRNDEERFVERHIGEALIAAPAALATGAARWLDLGSGGGLPAIPLALAGIGEHWTLVESRRMKTLFLRKAVDEMKLKNIEIVCARMENMVEEAAEAGPQFDGFTSRATLRLAPTLELATTFVRSGGSAFLWKGERLPEELEAAAEFEDRWTQGELIRSQDTPTVVVPFTRK